MRKRKNIISFSAENNKKDFLNNKAPFLSKKLAEELVNIFSKIHLNRIIKINLQIQKNELKVSLWENIIRNIPHFIQWCKIHWFILLPEEISIKKNLLRINIKKTEDINKIQVNPEIIKSLKLLTNMLALGGWKNFKNWNIFLANKFVEAFKKIVEFRILLEESYKQIRQIYKNTFVEKDITEIIFAEIFLHFIDEISKHPDIINHSFIWIELATFNEDHHQKIDHKLEITTTENKFDFDIQITVSNISRKTDILKIKSQKNLKRPYIIISLNPIFSQINLTSLRDYYFHRLENKIFLKKELWGNFPYFYRQLPEWLVNSLKTLIRTIWIFLIQLANHQIILKENSTIKIDSSTTIIIQETPKEFNNFKNDIYFIQIQHNWIPIWNLRYIAPTFT